MEFSVQTDTYCGLMIANWAHHAVTSAFSMNSLRRRCCCCKLTTHYKKIMRPCRPAGEALPPLLQHLAN